MACRLVPQAFVAWSFIYMQGQFIARRHISVSWRTIGPMHESSHDDRFPYDTRASMNVWKNDRLLYVILGLSLALLWTSVGLGFWSSISRERTFPQAQIDMLAAQCPNETLQGDAAAVERWLQQEWTFYVLAGRKRFFRPSSFNEFVRDFTELLSDIETGNPHWADVEGGCVALLEAYLAP